ncbi:immunity 22 family protein [Caldalkalibacillus salinus]|uniref:immunity 22 family protein n=1 Tax=Caldalkalibacillus salinus TaxID=2803787 RepID=UPI0019247A79|nr:immunity 22 family protein [Caldalkalibacillus salinus]
MKRDGYVSLWVGNFVEYIDLKDYLTPFETEDGLVKRSLFEEDFMLSFYDHDQLEIEHYKQKQSHLRDLLSFSTHHQVIVPKFVDLCGEHIPYHVNSVILLYNFQYSGRVGDEIAHIRYLGHVNYK